MSSIECQRFDDGVQCSDLRRDWSLASSAANASAVIGRLRPVREEHSNHKTKVMFPQNNRNRGNVANLHCISVRRWRHGEAEDVNGGRGRWMGFLLYWLTSSIMYVHHRHHHHCSQTSWMMNDEWWTDLWCEGEISEWKRGSGCGEKGYQKRGVLEGAPILRVERGEEGGSDLAMAPTVRELMPHASMARWRSSTGEGG